MEQVLVLALGVALGFLDLVFAEAGQRLGDRPDVVLELLDLVLELGLGTGAAAGAAAAARALAARGAASVWSASLRLGAMSSVLAI